MAVSEKQFDNAVNAATQLFSLKLHSSEFDSANEKADFVNVIVLLHRRDAIIERIIASSTDRHEIYDALIDSCAVILEKDGSLSPRLKSWLVSYLRGQAPRPGAKRGRKAGKVAGKTNGIKKLYIGEIAELISKEYQITPTRNDVSPPLSACDAVAEALVRLNLYEAGEGSVGGPKPYKRVKSALSEWRSHEEASKRMLDDIEE